MKHSLACVESKITDLERGLQSNVTLGDLQALCDMVLGTQNNMSKLERSMWEGIDVVQQLENTVFSVQAQCSGIERTNNEKATVKDVQHLGEYVSGAVAKISSLECRMVAG